VLEQFVQALVLTKKFGKKREAYGILTLGSRTVIDNEINVLQIKIGRNG
jgi:hypothetical protein